MSSSPEPPFSPLFKERFARNRDRRSNSSLGTARSCTAPLDKGDCACVLWVKVHSRLVTQCVRVAVFLSPGALQVPGRCWKIASVSIASVELVAHARYTSRDIVHACLALEPFSSSDSYRHAIPSLVLLEERRSLDPLRFNSWNMRWAESVTLRAGKMRDNLNTYECRKIQKNT